MSEGTLNLDEFGDLIERPNAAVRRAAESRRVRTGPAPTALGRLDELALWLAAAQGQVPVSPVRSPRLVVFAGDHGIAARGVSGHAPDPVSPGSDPAGHAGDDAATAPERGAARLVRELLEGRGPAAVLAREAGVPVRVVDVSLDCAPGTLPEDVTRRRVRRGSAPLDIADAVTLAEAETAFRLGVAVADEEADAGSDLLVLGDLSVGGTTAAGVLIAALCGTDASVVTGRGGAGIDDLTWMRKCAAVRDGLRRARPALGDQMQLLATAGGADLAAATGFLLQCAVRRTPVVLDGVVSAACALVGQRVAFRAVDWWIPGHVSGEPGQAKALDRMAMRPLLEQGVTVGGGAGALLALPLVRSAAALAARQPAESPGGDHGAAESGPAASPGDVDLAEAT
ncbi:nicotinate-nucleotide--dimethylbenzimidazole phosphoribosyltransferase [Streptomyces spiramenti]|uniref:Nicotinate-nucleotide--dimethylbenzimidazole phosphoribosyltransferase n=1 Tax=Streptomyces spiramenti TaxID=2720606 RepID=A0ABX1ALQ9_9ACTN|nr:nicotinate-nucleotide--dimethylbenzimidazole phosphoribosyltransferase [Streptomyces spiramenti]NJP65568.1 nicotinate-nucleotide--dimethylbenzimidazole phosphoribosyltransferase [Streptomyces spiramenti]